MFTGIVEGTGTVRSRRGQPGEGVRLAIDSGEVLPREQRRPGASISVDGICLTVSERTPDGFEVDASGETLDRTTLENWRVGRTVNLEPSLEAGEPIGGHFVTGHVDDTVRIDSFRSRGEYHRLTVVFNRDLRPFLAPKGSVTLDGMSLTVNRVEGTQFTVRIVPHTLDVTSLSERNPGDELNLEVDVLARYLYNFSLHSDELKTDRTLFEDL